MDDSLDAEQLLRRAEDAARAGADLAESVASSLERLAGTYRRMAKATLDSSRAEMLRDYAARADGHATHERAEATWLWSVMEDHADRRRALLEQADARPTDNVG